MHTLIMTAASTQSSIVPSDSEILPTSQKRLKLSANKQDEDQHEKDSQDNNGMLEKAADGAAANEASSAKSNSSNGTTAAVVVTGASERTIRGIRWILICAAIFSANILYGLDTTIVADIQGAVSETFDNVTQLGWLGVGFTLGSTVAILPLGKAFGIFDAKWVFIGCLVNFAAASALCGAAPNMNAMIVGRVWAGVGGAGMYLG